LHIAGANDALLIRPSSMAGGHTGIAFADPDGGTTPMYIRYYDDGTPDLSITGGNVGIGTTAPQSLLNIASTVNSGLGPVLTISNLGVGPGAGGALDYQVGYGVQSQPIVARIQSIDDGVNSSHLSFQTKAQSSSGALSEKMRLTSTGNVGIGTTSPGSKLEIDHGTSGNSGLKFTRLSSASTPAASAGNLGVDSSGNVVLKRSIAAGGSPQGANNNGAGANSHRFSLTAPSAGTYVFTGAATIWTSDGTALRYQVKWKGTTVYTVGTGGSAVTNVWQKIPFTYTESVAAAGSYTLDLVLSYGNGMESAELSHIFIPN
jgi:hypothetical protein